MKLVFCLRVVHLQFFFETKCTAGCFLFTSVSSYQVTGVLDCCASRKKYKTLLYTWDSALAHFFYLFFFQQRNLEALHSMMCYKHTRLIRSRQTTRDANGYLILMIFLGELTNSIECNSSSFLSPRLIMMHEILVYFSKKKIDLMTLVNGFCWLDSNIYFIVWCGVSS